MKIRKAIIPAAGLGTRFLPATKAQPKEMLPIIDKPVIQYIVEEAVASGIKEIAVITNRGKRSIEDHFDTSYELEQMLQRKNKKEDWEAIRKISEMANIIYIRQKQAKGLGDAILSAKNFIGEEPFAILLGDDLVVSETPCLKQLIDVYEYWNTNVIGVQKVPVKEVSKYGIIKKKGNFDSSLFYVDALVEKPKEEEAPSQYAIMGRYILNPEIFPILEQIPTGKGDEIQLTDALHELTKRQAILAYSFEGRRYDIGDKIGFIKATLDMALKRADIKEEVLRHIETLMNHHKRRVEGK